MKNVILLLFLITLSLPSMAQSTGRRLSTEEAAQKTPDQRFVYETDRKSKKKKKQLSTKKKVRVQEKQEKQVRKKKPTKRRK